MEVANFIYSGEGGYHRLQNFWFESEHYIAILLCGKQSLNYKNKNGGWGERGRGRRGGTRYGYKEACTILSGGCFVRDRLAVQQRA